MKIETFNKKNLPILRQAIDQALKSVTKDFGLGSLHLGNISFEPSGLSFTGQLKASVSIDDNPEAIKAKNEQNERISLLIGFNKNIVGEKISVNGSTFEIVDLKPDRPKYPIVAKSPNGSQYKLATDNLKFLNKGIEYKYAY